MTLENEIKGLCTRAKTIGFFGSYTRSDYVEGVSDINVFALSEDKSLLLELASLGVTPLVLRDQELKALCDTGEPLCYYLLYDSKLVCGSLEGFRFNKTNVTCLRLLYYSKSLVKIAIEGFLRGDQVSSVLNSYRSVKSYLRYRCCERGEIPLSDEEVMKCCNNIGGEMCDLFLKIVRSRRDGTPVGFSVVKKVREITLGPESTA